MVFSSTVFVFLFLPIVLSIYALLRRELRNAWLLIASLFFYAWGETYQVYIILFTILINFLCGLVIGGGFSRKPIEELSKGTPRTLGQKLALTASIVANLVILGFFKYFNWGIDSFNTIIASMGLDIYKWETTIHVALPLGISFFTFQAMSYTIDVYLGNTKATRNLLNFATYVALFPQLVAGPIVRYRQIADELVTRSIDLEKMSAGIKRFIIGLGKKMVIANIVAWPADQIFALPNGEITTALVWFAVFCYTLQIYFDFSAYSDMAIGLGLMFGFHFPENFNFPYTAQSIQDFWRRWHISLSTWFRDYLYIPIGGSRKGSIRTYFNLGLIFFLCGLWHGASWTFVVWGLYHGFFIVLERSPFGTWQSKWWRPMRHVYTILVFMFGWLLFRAESFEQATIWLVAMVGFTQNSTGNYSIGDYWNNQVALCSALGIIGAMPWTRCLSDKWELLLNQLNGFKQNAVLFSTESIIVCYLVFVFGICAMLLSSQTHNPFIYFRF
jgi:alginate O-acetyltransferase complex protein AlgI